MFFIIKNIRFFKNGFYNRVTGKDVCIAGDFLLMGLNIKCSKISSAIFIRRKFILISRPTGFSGRVELFKSIFDSGFWALLIEEIVFTAGEWIQVFFLG